jgi:hypothetical protein
MIYCTKFAVSSSAYHGFRSSQAQTEPNGKSRDDFFEQCKERFLCPDNGAKFKAFLCLEKSPRNHEKLFEIGQRENLKQ